MKAIAKIVVLAMTLALAFALTACGGNSTSGPSASSDKTADSSAGAPAGSESKEASSSSAQQEMNYSNDYFGLVYSLPAGWAYTDAETLAAASSPIASVAKSEGFAMAAMSADGETAIAIAIAEPDDEAADMTAEGFLNAQTERLESSLEGSYSYTTESVEITFSGMTRTLPANITTITENGKSLYIGQAVDEKGGTFLDVIAMGPSREDVETAFSAFVATVD